MSNHIDHLDSGIGSYSNNGALSSTPMRRTISSRPSSAASSSKQHSTILQQQPSSSSLRPLSSASSSQQQQQLHSLSSHQHPLRSHSSTAIRPTTTSSASYAHPQALPPQQQQSQLQQQQLPPSSSSAHVIQPTNYFVVVVNGMICHAEYPGSGNLCCNYKFIYGPDWEVVRVTGESACLINGMTQVAERAPGTRAIFTWNFPLEITFRSTNPFGWPKLVVTVSQPNGKGSFPIVGYGWCHVPLSAGRYSNVIRLFKPRPSSMIQGILASITGKQPEIINIATVCSDEGREVMRTVSEGAVKVTFDIVTKDMNQFGFEKPEARNYQHSQLHIGMAANADPDVLADEYSSLVDQVGSRKLS